jgi:hypothetical protein
MAAMGDLEDIEPTNMEDVSSCEAYKVGEPDCEREWPRVSFLSPA